MHHKQSVIFHTSADKQNCQFKLTMHIELGKSYVGKGLLILNQNQLHNAPTAPLLSRHERPDGHQRHEGRVQHKSQEQLEGHERPQQP